MNILLPINGNFIDDYGSVNIYSEEDNPYATYVEWQTTSVLANTLLNTVDFNDGFMFEINSP